MGMSRLYSRNFVFLLDVAARVDNLARGEERN